MNIKTDGLKAMMSKIDGKTMGAHALIGAGVGAAGTMGYDAYTGQDHSILGGAALGAIGGAGFMPAKNALTRGTANGTDVKVGVATKPTDQQMQAQFESFYGAPSGLTAEQKENIARQDKFYEKQQRSKIKSVQPFTGSGTTTPPFNSLSAQEYNAKLANKKQKISQLLGDRPATIDPHIRKNTVNYTDMRTNNSTLGDSISSQNISSDNSIDFVSPRSKSTSAPVGQGTRLRLESDGSMNHRLGLNRSFGGY